MPSIIPMKNLKDTAAVSRLCNESSEPIFVTKNGYGDMVLMSMEVYEGMRQELNAYKRAYENSGDIEMSEEEKILFVARRILDQHKNAFLELAK